jgi:hypothetical protein
VSTSAIYNILSTAFSPLKTPDSDYDCVLCYNVRCTENNGRILIMGTKKETELKTFIENVNKKDKVNGKKVVFCFVKRKRK